MNRRVLIAGLFFLLAAPLPAAEPPAPAVEISDDYIQGNLEAWLRYSYGAAPGQIAVKVEDGTVTLTGTAESEQAARRVEAHAAEVGGVKDVVNQLTVSKDRSSRWRSWSEWDESRPGKRWTGFPRGDVFLAPLADPKQPRFYTAWQRTRTDYGKFNFVAVGFGENFGLFRYRGRREGDGVQGGVSAAVFALFNIDTDSKDLLNADYIVGFPLSVRRGKFSGRVRIYHQSSHLGDEFLLLPQRIPLGERINLSHETLEWLGSFDWKGLRLYGGPSRIVSSETPLKRGRHQGGVEFRGAPADWRRARFIAGADAQSWEETGWEWDVSVKAGVMLNSPYKETRSLQVLAEYYKGRSPNGQFYLLDVKYWGLGIAFAY